MKKYLTKVNKISSTVNKSSLSFVWLRKKFQDIQKGIAGIFLKGFRFLKTLPHKDRKVKVTNIVARFSNPFKGNSSGARFARAGLYFITTVALIFVLVAYGRGEGSLTISGGGFTTGSVTKTVICQNGVSKTGSGADSVTAVSAAVSQCEASKVLRVTPADGAVNVSSETFVSLSVATDSTLDPSSITTANVVVKAGTEVVPGVISSIDTKDFVWRPSTKLMYSQPYTISASVKDTLGRTIVVTSTFTTGNIPVVCTLPAMANSANVCIGPPALTGYTWNVANKAWVADLGTLVTSANTLPADCILVGDACWERSVANGTIKFAKSGIVVTGINTRPIIFAFYRPGSGSATGYYVTNPVYADIVSVSATYYQTIGNGAINSPIFDVKGSVLGLKQTSNDGCWELVWDTGGAFVNHSIACPI